mmetsp:Transcript_21844/g.33834  ORF Transcript_21844/g.33834 Transcript_21844/m.33834 type:complete len:90 (+) Transcript_21844:2655-2924(+)
MQQKEMEGNYLDNSNYLLETTDQIKKLSDEVAAADLQLQYLLSVTEHNVMADGLVQKLPTKDLFLSTIDSIKEFHDHTDAIDEEEVSID